MVSKEVSSRNLAIMVDRVNAMVGTLEQMVNDAERYKEGGKSFPSEYVRKNAYKLSVSALGIRDQLDFIS